MYDMRAEHMATKSGTGLLWHVVGHEGSALCAWDGVDAVASKPDGVCDGEDYCRSCTNAVAEPVRRSADARDPRTPAGEAAPQKAGSVTPAREGHPHGR